MAWSDGEATWVVGGQPEAGVVLRGDVADLAEVPLPPETPLLNWVHGTGPDDVWVVGIQGTRLHWDGNDWTDHTEATEAAFWGVVAAGPDRAWAVGGLSAWGGEAAMMRRWDGTTWSPVPLPPELADSGNLFKVYADGTQVWTCGFRGVVGRDRGDGFTALTSGVTADIITVHGHPGEPPVFVGGRGSGQVLRAAEDEVIPLLSAPQGLSGVHVMSADRAVVVGERGFSAIVDLDSVTLTPTLLPTDHVLHGVFVDPDERAWAVGGDLYTAHGSFVGSIWTADLANVE
jgi:hypothetical protein